MLDGSIVIAAFDKSIAPSVQVSAIDEDLKKTVEILKINSLDISQNVGIILMDGLSGKEESLMDQIGNLTDLTIVGGSAGDDLKFTKTDVAVNGHVIDAPGAIAVLNVPAGFDLIKTQSFCSTGKTLTPTKVDRETRAVLEFDGKPAAQAYAEAVGEAETSNASNSFMTFPLGLMSGDEPFVRSPQKIANNNLHFYCAVHEGVELSVLKGTDIVADTAKSLEGSQHRALVVFNCILRTLDIKNQGKSKEFGDIFVNPTIGFATYGEAYIGHINQTATILALR